MYFDSNLIWYDHNITKNGTTTSPQTGRAADGAMEQKLWHGIDEATPKDYGVGTSSSRHIIDGPKPMRAVVCPKAWIS